MLRYEVSNLTCQPVSDRLIRKCVTAFARTTGTKSPKSFSLVFVDGKTIRKLNHHYRGRDKITDVLSFAERDSGFIGPGEEGELGEIFICLTQAARQARTNGWKKQDEVCRLLIHGLAHLWGYDHEHVSQKTKKEMEKFEAKVRQKMY